MCDQRITYFYPHTNHTYLPLLPSRKASSPFGWYSLRLPTKGWPGWVDLGGWLRTKILTGNWAWTHPSTSRARRWSRPTRSHYVRPPLLITVIITHAFAHQNSLLLNKRHSAGIHSRPNYTCHIHIPYTPKAASNYWSTENKKLISAEIARVGGRYAV